MKIDSFEALAIFFMCAAVAMVVFGCAQFDVYVEKNVYVVESEEVDLDYSTTSDIDGDLRQDLKDLLDLDLKLK